MNRRDFIILSAAAALPAAAHADGYQAGPVRIGHPWTRPAAAGQNAAGYLSLTNAGTRVETLLRVICPLAARATLHESRMTGGVMSMRALPMAMIPAAGQTAFAPGGLHIMLEQVSRPFLVGQRIPATLVFQRAGRVAIEFAVQTAAPGAGMGDMPGMSH